MERNYKPMVAMLVCLFCAFTGNAQLAKQDLNAPFGCQLLVGNDWRRLHRDRWRAE